MIARLVGLAASVAMLQAACSQETIDPRANPDEALIATLTDIDPDPDVVHVSLMAVEAEVSFLDGTPTKVWAYVDGNAADPIPSVPGPTLVAKPGDLVIVDFENALPIDATTIHWHGIRLDSAMDGAGNHHGDEVFPGESFQYRFVARDAGTFWYHPHVRADEQVERGLFGAVVVREEAGFHSERLIVLDDVDLGATGELDIEPSEEDIMMGRHGETILVDGRVEPELSGAAGGVERWRIVNAANGRYFAIEAGGRTMRIVESDGGALLAPIETTLLRVVPGERYTVDVELSGEAGDLIEVTSRPVDTGHGAIATADQALFTVRLDNRAATSPPPLKAVPFEPLLDPSATVSRELVLRETSSPELGVGFSINDEAWPFNTPLEGVTGASERWRIVNDSDGAHPFHLHGMFFQVLDDGAPRADLGWKDTVDVPAQAMLDLAVPLATGKWMFHCQILEHAERGMMGEIHVAP